MPAKKSRQVVAKPKRKIVGSKADDKGNIIQVLIEGNSNFTPLDKAIEMAKKGTIAAVPVKKTPRAKEHLRSLPNSLASDNLDEMANAEE